MKILGAKFSWMKIWGGNVLGRDKNEEKIDLEVNLRGIFGAIVFRATFRRANLGAKIF